MPLKITKLRKIKKVQPFSTLPPSILLLATTRIIRQPRTLTRTVSLLSQEIHLVYPLLLVLAPFSTHRIPAYLLLPLVNLRRVVFLYISPQYTLSQLLGQSFFDVHEFLSLTNFVFDIPLMFLSRYIFHCCPSHYSSSSVTHFVCC